MSLNLNVQLSGVDTSMPRLASGNYPLRIVKHEVVESKKVAGNNNLLMHFETTQPAESTRGDVIQPGYKLRRYYPLQQSETEGAPAFERDLAVLIDAAYGTDASNRPNLSDETVLGMYGKEVLGSVKVEKDEAYGESNSIGFLKHIA